ncbi:hypothetical protein ACIQU5_09055 [Streptomyces sp. NPDC090306]|uniref:hypothetical protein n=1 Tax=Streptomyces sp. NPDC090306 TaxID=3365961 RepID=UPI0037FDEEEF
MVVVVAVSLLPFLVLMLLVMDRIEDRMLHPVETPRRYGPRRPHLRLIPGGRRTAVAVPAVAEAAEVTRAA